MESERMPKPIEVSLYASATIAPSKAPTARPLAARINALGALPVPKGHTMLNNVSKPARHLKRVCVICGGTFTTNVLNKVLCSEECRVKRRLQYKEAARNRYIPKTERLPDSRTCKMCFNEFKPKNNTQAFCSIECRTLYGQNNSCGKVLSSDRYPKGAYVYGWYKDDDKLPFYIGIGRGSRATVRHSKSNGVPQACQILRERCKTFRVVVYRDRLTKDGALLLEGVLIDLFNWMGAVLTNERRSLTKKERLPLEMEVC